jgi:Flp pilus assembly pilin Flp
MKRLLRKFWRDERGLELSEYAVMAALIVIFLVVAITTLRGAIASAFDRVADTINRAGQ